MWPAFIQAAGPARPRGSPMVGLFLSVMVLIGAALVIVIWTRRLKRDMGIRR